MFIKYVLIKKFKSYRELSYMEPLSETVNLVIGPNGHGKSNFLDAIIFVLTDKYSNLRQEDKKLLVHEEPGEDIKEISVELVIDNKSRRFPVDKDTVNIQKIYHVDENKEEILINQKRLMKSDVYNLLESAGFCKQNPYYIIQQGKINTIINMNEFELFEIFSEVTGTKIYEEKKQESMKLLGEALENRNKIRKQEEEINDYIQRLESQTEDLAVFEKLEIKKKACECFIYNEKVADDQMNLDILEETKKRQIVVIQNYSSSVTKIRERILERLTNQNKLNKLSENLKNKITRCNDEINSINQHTYKEEASLKIMNEKNKNLLEKRNKTELELKQLTSEKTKLEVEQSKLVKHLNDLEKEILKIQKDFNELNSKNEILMLKGETGFKSDKEKKRYLEEEINKLKKMKDDLNSRYVELNNSISQDDNSSRSLATSLQNLANDININSNDLKIVNDSILDFKKKRIECVNNMKKIDIEINEIRDDIDNTKENIKLLEKQIPNIEILQAINKIKAQKFEGCYGILLDMIDPSNRVKNAIDLVAKDKLFSLIVDNLSTANKIMEFNKQNNGPVITILPIEWNRDVKNNNYPSINDAFPITSQIKLNEHFLKNCNLNADDVQPIINKIFGKNMMVKNYETGVKLASQFKFNFVTLENEIVYSGGYATKVGYYDSRRQRISIYEQLTENYEKIYTLENTKSKLENEKNAFANSEAKSLREMQNLIIKKNDLTFKIQELNKNQQTIAEEQLNTKEITASKKNMIENLLADKASLDQRINNFSDIISNKSISLSQPEIEEINNLHKEKETIEKKLVELEKAKINLQSKLNELIKKIEYITKRDLELKSVLNEIVFNVSSSNSQQNFDFTEENAVISGKENNLKDIQQLEKIKAKYKEDVVRAEKESETITIEIQNLKNELNKTNEKLNKEEAELKAILLNLDDITEKKAHLMKNIGNLGPVKAEALEKLANIKEIQMNLGESAIDVREGERKLNKILEPVYKKLDQINRKMKKFEKINRFALDDYKLFKQKREEVREKLEDLEDKEKDILDLIKALDEKKETAIQTTFDKVNKSFGFFFKELVPAGVSSLLLESSNSNNNSLQNGLHKAISIIVSFSGIQDQSMHQLSGGQKTAVAVASIFALSKIDPPPFYILDEIDAALDPSMRANLAKLIQNLSEHNQYIISTFKPEILDVANNIYQVKFVNKSSNLAKVTKEEARKFIKDTSL